MCALLKVIYLRFYMYDLYVWLLFEATSIKWRGVLIWHNTSSVGIVFSVCLSPFLFDKGKPKCFHASDLQAVHSYCCLQIWSNNV